MILITTGGGKVGQHAVTQLAQRKVPTRAGFHSQAKAAEARETGVEAEVLDFESPDSLATAFRGIDTMFLVSPGTPDQGRHEENLIAEAKRVGGRETPREIIRKDRRSRDRRLFSVEPRGRTEDKAKRHSVHHLASKLFHAEPLRTRSK